MGGKGSGSKIEGKYRNVNVPANKEPDEYETAERRSEILDAIIEVGHPDMLSRTELAARYGVDPSTITRDIDRLAEEVNSELADDAALITQTVFRKSIKAKMDEGEYMEAKELVMDWNEYLFETGTQARAPERIEKTVREAGKKSEAYEIVEDDEAVEAEFVEAEEVEELPTGEGDGEA
jgi:DNA-binding transcriptional ArsR family regulator